MLFLTYKMSEQSYLGILIPLTLIAMRRVTFLSQSLQYTTSSQLSATCQYPTHQAGNILDLILTNAPHRISNIVAMLRRMDAKRYNYLSKFIPSGARVFSVKIQKLSLFRLHCVLLLWIFSIPLTSRPSMEWSD